MRKTGFIDRICVSLSDAAGGKKASGDHKQSQARPETQDHPSCQRFCYRHVHTTITVISQGRAHLPPSYPSPNPNPTLQLLTEAGGPVSS